MRLRGVIHPEKMELTHFMKTFTILLLHFYSNSWIMSQLQNLKRRHDVLRALSKILHKENLSFLPYMLLAGWLKKYRECVLGAEYLILTTLNFELNVKHPYATLTTVLSKPVLAQSDMVTLALTLVSEGIQACRCQKFWGSCHILWVLALSISDVVLDSVHWYTPFLKENPLKNLGSSLWLQFHPHHIADGVVYLACKLLNWDSPDLHYGWDEFQLLSKPSCSLRCCASTCRGPPVLTQTAHTLPLRNEPGSL